MKHIHADSMARYAEHAMNSLTPWVYWSYKTPPGRWVDCDRHPLWSEDKEYREKPKLIRIGTREVPEPMQKPPERGTTYWVADINSPRGYAENTWIGSSLDKAALQKGQVHSTAEAAKLHSSALIYLTSLPQPNLTGQTTC